jgi:hypothetical protein
MEKNFQMNYLMWGLISTLINLLIFKIFISFNLKLLLTLIIYYLFAIMIKFIGYKYFVFKKKLFKSFTKQLSKYVIFIFSIMYLNYYYLDIAFNITNVEYFYLQVIWIGLTAPLAYFISKLFIFK